MSIPRAQPHVDQSSQEDSKNDVKMNKILQNSQISINTLQKQEQNCVNSQENHFFHQQCEERSMIQSSQSFMNVPQSQFHFLQQNQQKHIKQDILAIESIHEIQKPFKEAECSDDQEDIQNVDVNQDELASDKLQNYLDLIDKEDEYLAVYGKHNVNKKHKIETKNSQFIEQIEQQMDSKGITVLDSQQEIMSIHLKNVRDYANYEIITLDVCVGKYEKEMKIYNLLDESCFHSIKPFNSGSFGNIYLWRFLQREFIVKCISKTNACEHFFSEKTKHLFLKEILKEYMIAYIAGVLEVGPKVVNPFGFDLVVSRKCVEFFIERCFLPQHHLQNVHQKFQQIKSSLFKLHLLNIAHNDIKPENIMYSIRTQKLLFIDFGLSEYSPNPIGYKKKTKFIGTYLYSSPQMQKLLYHNESGNIDLYYNDAYSLNMALNKLFQIQKGPESPEDRPQSPISYKQINSWLDKIFLKFLIWQQNVQSVITLSNIIDLKRKFDLQQEILTFLEKLSFSPDLKKFYHDSIHYSVKELPKFRRLHNCYTKNISSGDVEHLQKNQDYKDFVDLYQHFLNMQLQDLPQQTTFKQRSITKDQKKLLIFNSVENQKDQKILGVYLDLINFFKRNENISIQQKHELSLHLIKKLPIQENFCKNVVDGVDPLLKPIFECLYFLLKYCLAQPINRWKKKHCIKIISLLIIMGWNIPNSYLVQWRRKFCTRTTDLQKVLLFYLQFLALQQVQIHRFFKICNEVSLTQLDTIIQAGDNTSNPQKTVQKSIYHHVLDCGKRQKNGSKQNSNQIFFNILNSMLQFDENPQIRTEEKLDSLLKVIEQLPHSVFRNKSIHQETKIRLIFWIDIYYSKIRVQQDKQIKILEKLKKLTMKSLYTLQIKIFTFQLLSKYSNLKNFQKLRQEIDMIDNTINCPIISENICVPRRYILTLMAKDYDKFQYFSQKLKNMKIQEVTDISLNRHIATIYQNVNFALIDKNNNDEFLYMIHGKIQTTIHNFIMKFINSKELRKFKDNRLSFSQLLMAVFSIRLKQKQLEHISVFYQNNHVYLEAFSELVRDYPDKELLNGYIFSKIQLLIQQEKHQEVLKMIENQPRINLSELKIGHNRQTSILINYYFLNIRFKSDNEELYVTKIKDIYEELLKKGAYHYIFNNKNIFFTITKFVNDQKVIFEYFKAITKHLSENPSNLNTQLFIGYLKDFVANGIEKAKQISSQELILSPKKESKITDTEKRFQKAALIFHEIYQYVKCEIRNSRLWQNPYIVLVLYAISMASKMSSKDIIKLHKMVARGIDFLNYAAKEYIFNFFYWRLNKIQPIGILDQELNMNRNRFLIKKHLKYTTSRLQFQQLIYFSIRREETQQSVIETHPGYTQVRKKLYKFYNNMDIIQKVNYLQLDVEDDDLSNSSIRIG